MDILGILRAAGRPMGDDELAAAMGLRTSEVVRRCRRLAFQGVVIREERGGVLVNRLDAGNNVGDGRLYFEDRISIQR